MSSLVVQDISNLANAFGQFAGSVAQLHQTRVNVEAERRQAQLARMQQNFLGQADLPQTDPNRMTSTNWRERFSQYQQEVDDYMGNIVDPTIRDAVGNMFQGQTSQFQIEFSNQMAKVEREETQFLAVATYRDLIDAGDFQGAIDLYRQHNALGMFPPEQDRQIVDTLFRPFINRETASGLIQSTQADFTAGENEARNLAAIAETSGSEADISAAREAATRVGGNIFTGAIERLNQMTEFTDPITGKTSPMTDSHRNAVIELIQGQQSALNTEFEQVYEDNENMSPGQFRQLTEGMVPNLSPPQQSLWFARVQGDILQGIRTNVAGQMAQLTTTFGRGISEEDAWMLKDQLYAAYSEVRTSGNLNNATRDDADDTTREFLDAIDTVDSWRRVGAGSTTREEAAWSRELFMLVHTFRRADTGLREASYLDIFNFIANKVQNNRDAGDWGFRAMGLVEGALADQGDLSTIRSGVGPDTIRQITNALASMPEAARLSREWNRAATGVNDIIAMGNNPDKSALAGIMLDVLSSVSKAASENPQMTSGERNTLLQEGLLSAAKVYELSATVPRDGLFNDVSAQQNPAMFIRELERQSELAAQGKVALNFRDMASLAPYYNQVIGATGVQIVEAGVNAGRIRDASGNALTPSDLNNPQRMVPVTGPYGDVYYVVRDAQGREAVYDLTSVQVGNRQEIQLRRAVNTPEQLAQLVQRSGSTSLIDMLGKSETTAEALGLRYSGERENNITSSGNTPIEYTAASAGRTFNTVFTPDGTLPRLAADSSAALERQVAAYSNGEFNIFTNDDNEARLRGFTDIANNAERLLLIAKETRDTQASSYAVGAFVALRTNVDTMLSRYGNVLSSLNASNARGFNNNAIAAIQARIAQLTSVKTRVEQFASGYRNILYNVLPRN